MHLLSAAARALAQINSKQEGRMALIELHTIPGLLSVLLREAKVCLCCMPLLLTLTWCRRRLLCAGIPDKCQLRGLTWSRHAWLSGTCLVCKY